MITQETHRVIEVLFLLTVSTVSECRDNAKLDPSLDSNVTKGGEITTTPTTTARRGEDKERKKIRDRFVVVVSVLLQRSSCLL